MTISTWPTTSSDLQIRLPVRQAQTPARGSLAEASAQFTSIPSDEVYFWTSAWQAGIARAESELAQGLGHGFPPGATDEEIIGWLRSAE